MSSNSNISDYFKFEVWNPQNLPQDAYLGAVLYQAPTYLHWTILEANLSFSRQPERDQNFIRIPFVQCSDDYKVFAQRWGEALLLNHVIQCLQSSDVTSSPEQLLDAINRVPNHNREPLRILTFSEDQRLDIERRIVRRSDPVLANGVEYLHLDPRISIDTNTVLMFTTLGKIVCGVSFCGYGIALCNWSIPVFKLPTVPKTRYNRVLEGQVI